jgi:glycosyltransferase involved in cell wall biosynthesis
MKQPLVSVIIPNYNYAAYLSTAIDSVFAQTWQQIEIIVVDDGSKDNSEDVLRAYGNQIRWVKQKNQGVSIARNRGVQEAKGELIAFLDADDIWLPAKLESQMTRWLADSELGLLHCGLVEFDEHDSALRSCLNGMEGWVAKEMLLLDRPVIVGASSTAVIPRNLFVELGGFDTRLSTSADWDLVYRIACRRRLGFVPEVLVKYRMHGSNMHNNVQAMEHDMLIAYQKAFALANAEDQQIRSLCYGNFHRMLAGSYFHAGKYRQFVRHALRSIWYRAENLGYLVGSPQR